VVMGICCCSFSLCCVAFCEEDRGEIFIVDISSVFVMTSEPCAGMRRWGQRGVGAGHYAEMAQCVGSSGWERKEEKN